MSGYVSRWSRQEGRKYLDLIRLEDAYKASRRRWHLRLLAVLAPKFKARLDRRAKDAYIKTRNLLLSRLSKDIRAQVKGKTCPGRYQKSMENADAVLAEMETRGNKGVGQ